MNETGDKSAHKLFHVAINFKSENMAIIDVVKYEQQEGSIVHKFPSCGLRWGTQLIVYPGQEAFFVKGGKVCDRFTEGTYTLKTNNVPILNNLINIPFGGDTPFQADVWFVSTLNRLDMKWGTETPIQLVDPKYNIIVSVRAYGQYGFRINDPEKFLSRIVGNKPDFSEDMLQSYFRGILLSQLTSIIASKIIEDKISVLDIPMHLNEISQYSQAKLCPFFEDYGVELLLFNFISINIPENDKSLNEIKDAKNLVARLKITGREDYKLQRSLDIMDKAAGNESGSGAAFINAGLGLGASVNIGSQIGKQMVSNGSNFPPPIPTDTEYYMAINGHQYGPYSYEEIKKYISEDVRALNYLAWKKGMADWMPLSTFCEFNCDSNNSSTPPPIPKQDN